MRSCIYQGRVRHRRLTPIRHQFAYSLYMMYLDLDELPELFEGYRLWSAGSRAIAQFRRTDHFGDPDLSLKEAVCRLVEERTGRRPSGPVRLLTHLRYFGYCFNPVSLFYCFDDQGETPRTIVAEVDNTPWGERHCYVLGESLKESSGRYQRFRFDKDFHVSPFMGMDSTYTWRFRGPDDRLVVHVESRRRGTRFFDATLALNRREITSPNLARVLASHPWMTAKVVAAIYFEALRLRLKGAPFYRHPARSKDPIGDVRS